MLSRTTEDHLREEYSRLLPQARRAVEELEAEVRYLLIPIVADLASHERIVVRSRVKECESALQSLRRRKESGRFNPATPEAYSLSSLRDLAGVRVLAFPKRRLIQVDRILRCRFESWTADPVPGPAHSAESLAFKYHGYCEHSPDVCAELQVVAMLIGLFWEVEHGALYKPAVASLDFERLEEMQERNGDVIRALRAFENQFEELVHSRIQ